MTRFYQGLVMGAIVLSAGIIGQLDAAEELSRKQANRVEALQRETVTEQHLQSLQVKTTLARLNEKGNQYP